MKCVRRRNAISRVFNNLVVLYLASPSALAARSYHETRMKLSNCVPLPNHCTVSLTRFKKILAAVKFEAITWPNVHKM